MNHDPERIYGTTILAVRRNGHVAVGGDGQVTLGQSVMKSNARKVRRLLEQPGALHQPLIQRADGMPADGHNSRLVALANHPYGSILEVNGGQIQSDEFAQPQSR